MMIQEAMKERHMVRKYLEKPIPAEIAARLQARLEEDNRISGLHLTFVSDSNDGLGTMAKLISKNVNNSHGDWTSGQWCYCGGLWRYAGRSTQIQDGSSHQFV